MRIAQTLVACGLLLALTGCFGGEIDARKVESGIHDWAQANSGKLATGISVDCPEHVAIDPGREFHCIVTDDQGESIRVTVTIENSDGDVTWVAG